MGNNNFYIYAEVVFTCFKSTQRGTSYETVQKFSVGRAFEELLEFVNVGNINP